MDIRTPPPLVLAMDTSTSACSAALWRDGTVLAARRLDMTRGQAEALMPLIESVMGEAGCAYDALGLIGVTVGPGSFTGVRVGLSAARGLALALGVACVGVTTTQAVAHGVPASRRAGRRVLAVVDSRRAEPFAQLFDEALSPLSEPAPLAPAKAAALADAAPSLLIVGDGMKALREALCGRDVSWDDAPGHPDPALVAALALAAHESGTALPPTPLYLRPPDATPAAP